MPTSTQSNKQLLSVDPCRRTVFPDCDKTGPSPRTFNEWMKRKYFPRVKIGKRVFLDPDEVRSALERRFKINATPAA